MDLKNDQTAPREACIQGIECDVHNCVYNSQCHCTAKKIYVGPSYASCSADTICATFEPQK